MNNPRYLFQSKSIVFLAAAMIIVAAWGVSQTGWVKYGLEVVTWVGVGVVVVGLLLTRSLLPGIIAHLFSIVIGLAWAFWMTTRLFIIEYTWPERWQELILRLESWYTRAMQGGVSHDNLMFILQMGIIVWAMGYLTLWFLFRSGKVWHAIVPCGLVLVINLYYAPENIVFWFLLYILLSLLLVIRFNLFNQQSKWRAEGFFYPSDIGFDFLRDGLIFSALIIMLAWLTPPVIPDTPKFFKEFDGTWHDIQGNWNRLYADLNYRDSGRVGSFSSTLTLGGARHLTDEHLMDVKVEGDGRYWRATVYDEYTDAGWRNTDENSDGFGPSTNLSLPTFAARVPITQTYTFFYDDATALYAMSNPTHLDRNAKATFNEIHPKYSVPSRLPSWPNKGPAIEEITYIRSNAALNHNENYQVVSAMSRATVGQLKETGTDYPVWVTARYLQLPDTITQRTRQLAQELTAEFNNPFAKAEAIESYLRREITYNEQIALPPQDREKVDYILFETQEAYCDYYASSMVVMLRSVGIPARLAVGFAHGDVDENRNNLFHVLNSDAHSWVEVYFPRYGWIEFEPTSSQPIITRFTASQDSEANTKPDIDPKDFENDSISGRPDNIPIDEEFGGGNGLGTSIFPSTFIQGSLTAIVIALIIATVGVAYWWRQQQKQASQNIFNLYANMIRLARWMGASIKHWQTPYEHAVAIKNLLPQHNQEIDLITNEYVRQTFGKGATTQRNVVVQTAFTHESALAWRRLRPEMIKVILKQYLPW